MDQRRPLHRIDRGQAELVAEVFLGAPRAAGGGLVWAAYAALARQADRWFAQLTAPTARRPIRVVATRCPEPYPTGAELARQVRSDGVLELPPSRHDRDHRHPGLDPSAYDRFRAVHDLVSHAGFGYGFDRHGEFSGWIAEDRMYTGLARWALATELHGEHSVRWTTGRRAEHKAVLLPLDLVRASRRRALGQSVSASAALNASW
jgi:hypothetical protein